jgi:bifunctional non-homologous end joining protein LigD
MSGRLKSDTSKPGIEATQEESARAPALSRPAPAPKAKRARKRNPDQREMLLPIAGGAGAAKVAPEKPGTKLLHAKLDLQAHPPKPTKASGEEVIRGAADVVAMPAARPRRHLTAVETLEYLAREWEAYGTIDAINMRHVYWTLETESERASAPETGPTMIPHATARADAKRSRVVDAEPPVWMEPQLCKLVDKAPSGPEWVHEVAFDGHRMAARIDHGDVQLLTRSGQDWTDKYPSIVEALEQLPVETAYIDGALCGVTAEGAKAFELMQPGSGAPVYYAFDLIELDGAPVHRMVLLERKRWLASLLRNFPAGVVYVDHHAENGERLRRLAGRRKIEGIVSKRVDAPYSPGNRGIWVKSSASISPSS